MSRRRTMLAAALLVLAAWPASAQGPAPRTVPPNPFASNYPSAAPPPAVVERRRSTRTPGPRRAPGLRPPGRIPE